MSLQDFLYHYGHYVAYAATWSVHVFYLGTLVRRFSRLGRELKELERR